MNRRLLSILLPCSVAVLVTGCATFSDNDAVARVGDSELSVEELAVLVDTIDPAEAAANPALTPDAALPDEVDDANVARQLISAWIVGQIFELPPAAVEESYAIGMADAGISCPKVLVVQSIEEAEQAADRLTSGEPFATVFDELNIDPQLAEDAGSFGCLTAAEIGPAGNGNPFVDAVQQLSAVMPVIPAALPQQDGSQIGLVVAHTPFEELAEADAERVTDSIESAVGQSLDIEAIDVYVNPRYGDFDVATGAVVPLR